MELRVYLDFLRRRWWLVALGPLVAGLASYFVSQQLTPVYKSSATILVDKQARPGVIDYNDILTSERLTNTYAQLVERPAVLDEVIKRLDLAIPRSQLESKISVTPIKDTQLLSLSAKDRLPEMAALLANTTAQVFSEDKGGQLISAGTVSIAKPAEAAGAPSSPKVMFNVAFAIILGTIVSAGLAILLDYFDDTVKTSENVEVITGLPTLGMIGHFRAEAGPAVAGEQHSRHSEAYRQLRTNVHFTTLGDELKTIVVTSSNPSEGKSTTAANLATVLAQAGERVILVDTDLRRSSLRKTFKTRTSIGLTGLLLSDRHDPSQALVETRWENLLLLPAGVLPPNPSELLTSPRMTRVIQQLREMADYVIFDSPPILAVTDAIVLAARTDGTILVTEAGGTRTDALRQAARSLKQANARVLGVVLNKAKQRVRSDYYYLDDKAPAKLASAAAGPEPVAAPAAAAFSFAPERDSALEQSLMAMRAARRQTESGLRLAGSRQTAAVLDHPPFDAAMNDLLSHTDNASALLRSLKPRAESGHEAGL